MAGGVRRAPGRERGAAAVEFALLAVPLLTILMGIIAFGLMLSFRQSISQAAAEGARAAAVAPPGTDYATRKKAAEDAIAAAIPGTRTCGDGVLTCTIPDPGSAATMTVLVSYDYDKAPVGPEFPGLGVVMPDKLVFTSEVRIS
jgi:Flp pilus assembly protein TadG